MFGKREPMANTLRMEKDGIEQVRVARIARTSSVKKSLSSMKQEGYFDVQFLASFLHGNQLFPIIANMIWPILCSNKIKALHNVRIAGFLFEDYELLTTNEIRIFNLELYAVLDFDLHT
jgi:hypothetical protein